MDSNPIEQQVNKLFSQFASEVSRYISDNVPREHVRSQELEAAAHAIRLCDAWKITALASDLFDNTDIEGA